MIFPFFPSFFPSFFHFFFHSFFHSFFHFFFLSFLLESPALQNRSAGAMIFRYDFPFAGAMIFSFFLSYLGTRGWIPSHAFFLSFLLSGMIVIMLLTSLSRNRPLLRKQAPAFLGREMP